jgi:predicted small lipoprotein YifL
MKKVIGLLGMALMLISLAGCGLKGPLYFPPPEKPKKQQAPTEEQKADAARSDVGGLVTGSGTTIN